MLFSRGGSLVSVEGVTFSHIYSYCMYKFYAVANAIYLLNIRINYI